MQLQLIRRTGQPGDVNRAALYRAGDDFVLVARRLVEPKSVQQIVPDLGVGNIAVVVPEEILAEIAKNY